MKTQEERNKYQREYRHKNKNKCDRAYHHTIKGYLVRNYRNMLSRVTGVNKKYAQYYLGKPILPREDFYAWALSNEDYIRLFKAYEASGWNTDLAPSVDRKDTEGGYTLDNIRYMTLQENRELGLANGRAKMAEQRKKEVPCPF